MLSYVIKLLKALNSNSKPSQISHSFCIGFILGIMPKDNLLWYCSVLFFAFVRINKTGYLLSMLIATCFAYLLDPFFHKIGMMVLTFEPLVNIFHSLLQMPFVGFTNFNQTVVMGSLVFGFIAYIPLFFIFIFFIKFWRKVLAPKFANSKILQGFYKLPLIKKITTKISEAM